MTCKWSKCKWHVKVLHGCPRRLIDPLRWNYSVPRALSVKWARPRHECWKSIPTGLLTNSPANINFHLTAENCIWQIQRKYQVMFFLYLFILFLFWFTIFTLLIHHSNTTLQCLIVWKKSIITNILLKSKTSRRLQHNIASFKILIIGKHTQAYAHTHITSQQTKNWPRCVYKYS